MEKTNLGTWYGRTSPEHCQAQTAKTSGASSKKPRKSQTKQPLFLDLRKGSGQPQDASWVMGIPLHGESSTLNFGESPSVVVESRLSQILQGNPHPKYCLSLKACQRILRRAEKRGNPLPVDTAKKIAEALGFDWTKFYEEEQG